jgi:hypothetical protein
MTNADDAHAIRVAQVGKIALREHERASRAQHRRTRALDGFD